MAGLQEAQESVSLSTHRLVPDDGCLRICDPSPLSRVSSSDCLCHPKHRVDRSAYHFGEPLDGVALPMLRTAIFHDLVVVFQRPVRSSLCSLQVTKVCEF
jgi:hypothetical protein